MSAHAKLSPSGAHRWLACPGSVVLEAAFPDEGSVYADEGTAAHLLASYCLEDKMPASSYIGEVINVGERHFKVDADMATHVQSYVDFVHELAEEHGGTILVEQRVPIGHLTGEEGAEGTSDVVIIAKGHILVVDLKYGMGVRVDAVDNPQTRMYALGALERFGQLYDFGRVTSVIHMPRLAHVSSETLPVQSLLAFGEVVAHGARKVRAAEAETDRDYFEELYLAAAEKQCRFCRAKATCPALKAEVSSLVHEAATLADFGDLVPQKVDMQTGENYLSVAMSKVGLVEDWCKAVRAEVERRLLAGQSVEGYKLVEGRRGPRKWVDETQVEALFKSMRLKQAEMYEQKLISPTTAEKLLKKTPARWDKAQGLITQSEGKPSVAPATDKRPALDVKPVSEDFRGIFNT